MMSLCSREDTGLPSVVEQGGLSSARWGEEVGATQGGPLHWHEEDPGLLEAEETCISAEAGRDLCPQLETRGGHAPT